MDDLPYTQCQLDWLPEFAQSMRRRLKRVNTTTEQARREALIFPYLVEYLPLHPIPQNLEFVTRTIMGILQGEAIKT
ncbi:MAG: hypothetical protein RIE73_25610 [Coleofasciculus sp. C1-SOL-03]|jgi:hypothetical protein|uniref:hypothetical protein n=1 Tax=Coleofasciculus sp. C1-SOL-03 TaxID=3069522 RepID=UPI0032FCDFC4